ncbi:MAG: phosphate signaling complex protein PhoU [Firmicutes bacterium]|nr:phosphate signaling complex protein PhoU [Bacillota bacterium]
MRSRFDMQLEELHREMITMGMFCETAIAKASKSLLSCDISMANELPELLTRINQKERDIEAICLRLLLHQQPVAKDLRTVSAALKMVTDVERIGDQSADFAEIVAMGHITNIPDTLPIREMATAVMKMVTESIDAFVKQDRKTADLVIEYDDVVDGLFNDCKAALIDLIKSPDANGEAMVDLLMISKYFERIGDHAVNIAKWVLFSITGTI